MPSEPQLIDAVNITLDVGNYRVGAKSNWQQALKALVEEQGQKIVELAEHILENGVNPIESLAVVPSDTDGFYVAVEGNRRITVLRVLLEPELVKGTTIHAQIRKLSAQKDKLPKQIRCVVFQSKEEAYPWIRLKHDVGWGGAATVQWTAVARRRAAADQGKFPPAHDLLQFVLVHGSIDADVEEILTGHRFPISTLERLLGSPDVRNELGLVTGDVHLKGTYDKAWTLAVLTDIVVAIARQRFDDMRFTVREINKVEQQRDFIQRLFQRHPRKATNIGEWAVFEGTDMAAPTTKSTTGKTTAKKRAQPKSTDRKHLVPSRCPIAPPSGRENDILIDLKKLHIDKFTNSVAIVLRVFLEFSVEHYCTVHKLQAGAQAKLKHKTRFVADDLKARGVASDRELKAVNVALGNRDSILSIDTLHSYVHHPDFHPSPRELKVTWDRLEAFLYHVWHS